MEWVPYVYTLVVVLMVLIGAALSFSVSPGIGLMFASVVGFVLLFIHVLIVKPMEKEGLLSIIESGKPVECKGMLIKKPALYIENGKKYVKTESGVLINISYCKKP